MAKDEFSYFMADIFAVSVQYGYHTDLCDTIHNLEPKEAIPHMKAIADKFSIRRQLYDSNNLGDTSIYPS